MARLPKKPKQPKMSSSVATWERYYARVQAWAARVKAIKEGPKKKAAMKAKADAIKNKTY